MRNKRQLPIIIICMTVVAILVTAALLYVILGGKNKEDLPANGQSAELSSVVSNVNSQLFPTDSMRLAYSLDEIDEGEAYINTVKELGFTGIVTTPNNANFADDADIGLYIMVTKADDFKYFENGKADGVIIDTETVALSEAEEYFESLSSVAVGIKVKDSVEAVSHWLTSGKVNFIVPEIEAEFESTADKWEETAKIHGLALIFMHDTNRDIEKIIGEYEYAFLKTGYRGSIYPFEGDVKENENINKMSYYWISGEQEAENTQKLQVIEPQLTLVTTYDEYLTLRLKYNSEKELIINSQKIETDGSGSLIYDVYLEYGENSISVENGDEIAVIDVTRKVKIIQSVSPMHEVSYEGDSVIELTAVASKNATVTVTIDGQTIDMVKQDGDEGASDVSVFTASYRLPPSTNEKQPLGNAVFTAISEGQTHTVIGGKIYVRGNKQQNNGDIKMITVNVERNSENKKYGVTYNPEYRDDTSAPTQYILPKGSVDYVIDEVDKVIDGVQKSYYLLSCGVMIYKSDCAVQNVKEKQENIIKTANMEVSDRYSTLEFEMSQPVAVVPKLTPVNFLKPHGAYGYLISEFNAKRVEFLFANTVDVCDIENLTSSKLFSSYEWKTVNDSQKKLVLTLKEAGKFHGFSTYFNSDGNFVIRFKNTVAATKADNEYGYSLEGIRITLDPGHNGSYPYSSGADGYDKKYCEAEINLQYAKIIKEELEKLGATVILTRSENNVTMSRDERVDKIRKSECDALIAIHQNGSERTSDYGTSTYYFYPYSMPLAKEINKALAETYKENIYTSGEKHEECDKGCMYYPYYMTRVQEFPCVLIETGYITNEEEYNYIIGSETKELLAKAYVKGIVEYFASLA